MGSFSEAFDAGQKSKQEQEERERQQKAAEHRQSEAQVTAARKWVQDQLIPVIEAARRDLVGKVGVTTHAPPIARGTEVVVAQEIFFTPPGGKRPLQVAFHVTSSGAVNVYEGAGQANTIGAISTITQVQVRQELEKVLRALGERQ